MNIILIGMPGAGKSTIGVLAAKARGMQFVDTDLLVQKRYGMKLQTILQNHGVDRFVELEAEVIRGLSAENTVIATGGSVVLNQAAMEHLKQMGKIIFLDVPLFTLLGRLKNLKTRGVVMHPDEKLTDVYNRRRPLYVKYADATVKIPSLTYRSTERTLRMLLKQVDKIL